MSLQADNDVSGETVRMCGLIWVFVECLSEGMPSHVPVQLSKFLKRFFARLAPVSSY